MVFTITPLKYGKVIGRFVAAAQDGVDSDVYPDGVPLTGTVTFTASTKKLLLPGASPDPATIELVPIVGQIDANGYLTSNGAQGVWLVATDDATTNPTGFTYSVQYNLNYNNAPFDTSRFDIPVPTSSLTTASTWTDLGRVAPVTASNGTPTVQGPPGPAPTFTTRNVTTTTDPAAAGFTLIPGSTPGAYWVDYVQLVGTGGSGTGTVSKVAGISPDGTGNVPLTPANIGAPTTADVVTAQATANNALSQANSAQASANTAQASANTANAGLAGKADNSTLASYALLASPTFTGAPKAPTPATADNSTLLATTAFVKAVVAAIAAAGSYGAATVGWNTSTASWFAARPAVAGAVLWISSNSVTATRPADMAIGDSWIQHPDSATA